MDMTAQVERVLEQKVRPLLRGHGGDVKLLDCRGNVVTIELLGACAGCPSADLSTKGMIQDILKAELPEIKRVEVEHPVSGELLDLARALLYGKEPKP